MLFYELLYNTVGIIKGETRLDVFSRGGENEGREKEEMHEGAEKEPRDRCLPTFFS